jgi:hypothetical protein
MFMSDDGLSVHAARPPADEKAGGEGEQDSEDDEQVCCV